jgi:hypothetical protein
LQEKSSSPILLGFSYCPHMHRTRPEPMQPLYHH